MILKSADDKSKRLALLEELQRSQMLDFSQKKWLQEELMRQKKGIKESVTLPFIWTVILKKV